MKSLMKNKQGDIESIIYIVIFLFVLGIVLFFVSHINNELYSELNSSLHDSDRNTTQTEEVIKQVNTSNSIVWDYAFLGLFIGSLIAIGLSAYAVRISPVFYWVYGIMSLIVLGVGTILSNIWQDTVADPEFTTTLLRFPITNSLLGTYYPVIVTGIIIFSMLLIFGKPPSRDQY